MLHRIVEVTSSWKQEIKTKSMVQQCTTRRRHLKTARTLLQNQLWACIRTVSTKIDLQFYPLSPGQPHCIRYRGATQLGADSTAMPPFLRRIRSRSLVTLNLMHVWVYINQNIAMVKRCVNGNLEIWKESRRALFSGNILSDYLWGVAASVCCGIWFLFWGCKWRNLTARWRKIAAGVLVLRDPCKNCHTSD